MNLALYFAKRYLFSKKSTNAINIISGISMFGVLIGSAALIVILSVFNGFEALVLSLYNRFTPDIKIELVKGKTFAPNTSAFSQLKSKTGTLFYVEALEEKALLRFGKNQYIATVKGVSDDFLKTHALDSMIIRGNATLGTNEEPRAIIGSGVEYYLSMNIESDDPLTIFSPRKNMGSSIDPTNDLNRSEIYVSGVFQVQQDFDLKYVLVPLSFARKQLDEGNNVSSVEIYLKKEANLKQYKRNAKELLGDNFKVRDRFEQNELLYKILNSEKWAVYLILTFVLIIAICNIIGSLTMLVIDKKKDIAILLSMGANKRIIRYIFLFEGLLISMVGTLAGLTLGAIFCFVQLKFGLIKLGQSGTFVMDKYPVEMQWPDFLLVFITVFVISFIASWSASRLSVRNLTNVREELTEQ
ncbi:FtsX-like permease family protein [Solitalea sp. MAHUQ-68]|uniref:FtsX-like permease family protein n=1 Tax=Solitalea agri TaxID=2953739 RepID=A0A9X2F1M6_9SPHI|nr:FtsX-like permease family protein [Solitalea agri]MCO4293027.1 FtsX-like permease family protein [Solitalea agri]